MNATEEQETLLRILESMPDNLRDGQTDEIADARQIRPSGIRLNSQVSIGFIADDIRLYINDSRSGTGLYKRKHGQFNIAGMWKRMHKLKKESAEAIAEAARNRKENIKKLVLLRQLLPIARKGSWQVTITTQREIDDYNTEPRLILEGEVSWTEIWMDKNGFFTLSGEHPPLTKAEAEKVLTILARAITREDKKIAKEQAERGDE